MNLYPPDLPRGTWAFQACLALGDFWKGPRSLNEGTMFTDCWPERTTGHRPSRPGILQPVRALPASQPRGYTSSLSQPSSSSSPNFSFLILKLRIHASLGDCSGGQHSAWGTLGAQPTSVVISSGSQTLPMRRLTQSGWQGSPGTGRCPKLHVGDANGFCRGTKRVPSGHSGYEGLTDIPPGRFSAGPKWAGLLTGMSKGESRTQGMMEATVKLGKTDFISLASLSPFPQL